MPRPSSPTRADGFGRLSRFVAALPPDVVNSHLFRSTGRGRAARPLARRPASSRPTTAARAGGRRGRFLADRLRGAPRRPGDRRLGGRADVPVRGKGYPAARITVVPNGRDLSVFQPGRAREAVRKELGLDRTVPLVGVVGRLEPQKGHTYLLDAWPAVRASSPTRACSSWATARLRGRCRRRPARPGIADSVVFAGFRTDVPRMLDALDVLCLPSLYEGMPLTAIEGSAMARPVVATAVDGTPEVVRDGQHRPAGAARRPAPRSRGRCSTCCATRTAARRMGQAGRDWALLRFDLDRQVTATAHVYRSGRAVTARDRLVFWLAAALLVYTWLGYPLLLRLLARPPRRPGARAGARGRPCRSSSRPTTRRSGSSGPRSTARWPSATRARGSRSSWCPTAPPTRTDALVQPPIPTRACASSARSRAPASPPR